MTLYCFPEQVAAHRLSSRDYVGCVREAETAGPAQLAFWQATWAGGKQMQDTGRSSSLGLRPREETPYHPQDLKLLPQLQAADSSFFSRKDFPWYFLKLWKIIQLVSGAEKTGFSLICSSSLETVPLFSAVRMGGNFSTSIITGDISGQHYLRSLWKTKILPRFFQGQRYH